MKKAHPYRMPVLFSSVFLQIGNPYEIGRLPSNQSVHPVYPVYPV
ncbi:MAG: hypothetical protein WCU80_05010 [Paludibacteraceae bacterium]